MPLVGVLDTQMGWEVGWDAALAGDGFDGFPYTILKAIKDDTDQEHDLISASQLAGCLRQAYLRRTVDYYEEPGRRIPLLMGNFVHHILEKGAPEDALTEVPLQWTTPHGITVTGHADFVWPQLRLLTDWKTARWVNPEKLPYGHHEIQINLYAFMLRHNEIEPVVNVEELQLVYIDLTGPARNGGHNGVVVVPIDFWPDEKVASFITARAGLLYLAQEQGTIPPMIERDERWACRYCAERIFNRCREIGE
jgi:hypothetical protein